MIPATATVSPNTAGLPETGVSGSGASVGLSASNGGDVGVIVAVATTQIQLALSVHDAFRQYPLLMQTSPEVQSVSNVHAELHPTCGVGVFVGVFVFTGVLVGVLVSVLVGVSVIEIVPVGVDVEVNVTVGV
jgi:hypothetical protein